MTGTVLDFRKGAIGDILDSYILRIFHYMMNFRHTSYIEQNVLLKHLLDFASTD